MSLPHTLIGIVGFAIFLSFLFGQVILEDTISPVQTMQEELFRNVNNIVNPSSEPSWIPEPLERAIGVFVGVFQVLWGVIVLTLAYVVTFIGYSGLLPSEFIVLFMLVGIGALFAILKLLRGVWDF